MLPLLILHHHSNEIEGDVEPSSHQEGGCYPRQWDEVWFVDAHAPDMSIYDCRYQPQGGGKQEQNDARSSHDTPFFSRFFSLLGGEAARFIKI